MYKVIGIDEAGKGPVIGSLVVGFSIIVLQDKNDLDNFQDHLKALGVKDSKLLTSLKRRELFNELKNHLDMKFVQLTPAMIDNNNAAGGKLNELEIKGILTILEHEKPDLFIIDSLTAKPKEFGDMIVSRLSFNPEVISENKADTKYPLVGAASIIAKELREQEIEQIKQELEDDMGSGYPADPITKAFIKKHYKNKELEYLFRKSWQTYKDLMKEEGQRGLHEFS